MLRNLRSVHADPLALLVQDFFLIAPASSNSTLLGRVAGEERTRGEGGLLRNLRSVHADPVSTSGAGLFLNRPSVF